MPGSAVIAVIGEAVADAFPRSTTPAGPVAGSAAGPVAGSATGPVAGSAAGPVAGSATGPATRSLELEVRPGGGPVNTAVALSRLGSPVRYLGRLSAGLLGDLLRDHLVRSNVDLSAAVAADGPATLAVTSVDPEGHTRYDFYLTGTTDWQWTAAELHPRVLDGVHCVHTGSLALALPPGGPLIEDLLAAARPHCVVSIDPNVRPGIVAAQAYRDAMRRWSGLADIIRLSTDDLAVLRPGGAGTLSTHSFDAACADWHAAGVRLVVLTRGAHGAIASLAGVRVSVPAVPARVVDTVGAGDAFTAGLLHRLDRAGRLAPDAFAAVSAEEVAEAMRFAALVASRICAVRGADPPWHHELAQGRARDTSRARPLDRGEGTQPPKTWNSQSE